MPAASANGHASTRSNAQPTAHASATRKRSLPPRRRRAQPERDHERGLGSGGGVREQPGAEQHAGRGEGARDPRAARHPPPEVVRQQRSDDGRDAHEQHPRPRRRTRPERREQRAHRDGQRLERRPVDRAQAAAGDLASPQQPCPGVVRRRGVDHQHREAGHGQRGDVRKRPWKQGALHRDGPSWLPRTDGILGRAGPHHGHLLRHPAHGAQAPRQLHRGDPPVRRGPGPRGPVDLLHRRPPRDHRGLRPGHAARARVRHRGDPDGGRPGPRALHPVPPGRRAGAHGAVLDAHVGHRDRRAQPDAPVPRQVRRPAPAGLRRPADVSRAPGGRRARLPRARGAGGGGPARAPRADARRRAALQRALRRDVRRPRGAHPAGRRPRARPAGSRAQDVDHRRHRAGHGLRGRGARRRSGASSSAR